MSQISNAPPARYDQNDSGVQKADTLESFNTQVEKARTQLSEGGRAGSTTVVLDADNDGVAEKRVEVSGYSLNYSESKIADKLRNQYRVNTNTVDYSSDGGPTVTHERSVHSEFKDGRQTVVDSRAEGTVGDDGTVSYGATEQSRARTVSQPEGENPGSGGRPAAAESSTPAEIADQAIATVQDGLGGENLFAALGDGPMSITQEDMLAQVGAAGMTNQSEDEATPQTPQSIVENAHDTIQDGLGDANLFDSLGDTSIGTTQDEFLAQVDENSGSSKGSI